MEIYKLKDNAWEEFQATLNEDDVVSEGLHQFLIDNSWKEIKILDSNDNLDIEIWDLNDEKSFWLEWYQFDKIIVQNEDNTSNFNEFENEEVEEFEKISNKDKIFYWVCLFFWLIIFIWLYMDYNHRQEEKKQAIEIIKEKTEQERLSEEIKNLIDQNTKQYEFQKNMRIKIQEFQTKANQEINNSIQNVKNNKLRIAEIEKLQIEKAQ